MILRRENQHHGERDVKTTALCVRIKDDLSDEHLRFERLISDLSARFVNVGADLADNEIERSLAQILNFFKVDRCALLRISPDRKQVYVTHASHGEGIERVSGDIELSSLFPWLHERVVLQGQPVRIDRLDELPERAGQDRSSCTAMGILSFLNVPLFFEGRVSSLIVINAVRSERSWSDEYIPRLRLLGEIFINALEHRQSRLRLDERLKFDSLLADISAHFVNLPADLIDSGIEDAQRRICELLDLDRSTLWEVLEEEPMALLLTHMYQRLENRPIPERMNAQDLFPWSSGMILNGETVVLSKISDLPPEADRDRESFHMYGSKSNVLIPLSVGNGPVFGLLSFAVIREERCWKETVIKGFRLIAYVFANALERKRMEGQLRKRLQEIEYLRERFEKENIYLREEVNLLFDHVEIVGQSSAMKKVLAQAEQVARTDSSVLLLGETGTGKELLARTIHSMSLRKDRPMVKVNCASLPPTLIESELFGREKGAYTGAMTKMIGRFEIADGSTLFLDEIGELPFDLQGKLLRVLEEGNFERLGSTKSLHVNVRIIAATNRDIKQEVEAGRFRPDLFYRLSVFPLLIPPLRERSEDIPLLVRTIVKEFQKKMGKEIESISKKTMQALQAYSWPGNVRELRNAIEHAMILSRDKTLDVHIPVCAPSETAAAAGSLSDMERMHVLAVLEKTGWRIAGQGGAAEVLGLKRTTLQAKMKKLGIRRSNKQMPH
ncbi:MAG: sigma 54-interacting transcriptional regulator [Nitrospirota bacterium]|nr:sigma 54-interacting transcriptional regulator [Nitrospirota bacterium]